MNELENVNSHGIGFCGLLTIVFIALKLLGKINWSWWLVLAPLWVPVIVLLAIVLIGLIVMFILKKND